MDFLSQLGFTLLDGSHDHVATRGGRKSVQPSTAAHDGDNEEVLSARVVGAVDHGADGEGEGHSELGTSLGLVRHLELSGRTGGLGPSAVCVQKIDDS